MTTIVVWIVFGLVVGLIARALYPGRQHMGLLSTMLLGIGGSLLGGAAGNLLSHGYVGHLGGAGFLGSLLGALVLLGGWMAVNRPAFGERPTAH